MRRDKRREDENGMEETQEVGMQTQRKKWTDWHGHLPGWRLEVGGGEDGEEGREVELASEHLPGCGLWALLRGCRDCSDACSSCLGIESMMARNNLMSLYDRRMLTLDRHTCALTHLCIYNTHQDMLHTDIPLHYVHSHLYIDTFHTPLCNDTCLSYVLYMYIDILNLIYVIRIKTRSSKNY